MRCFPLFGFWFVPVAAAEESLFTSTTRAALTTPDKKNREDLSRGPPPLRALQSNTCTGSPPRCGDLSTSECSSVQGCRTRPRCNGLCSGYDCRGSSFSCSYYRDDEARCRRQQGCSWKGDDSSSTFFDSGYNDRFSRAATIVLNDDKKKATTIRGSTTRASSFTWREDGRYCGLSSPFYPAIFEFTAAHTDSYKARITKNNGSWQIAVFKPSSSDSVFCFDYKSSSGQDDISWDSSQGSRYYVAVAGYASTRGTYEFEIEVNYSGVVATKDEAHMIRSLEHHSPFVGVKSCELGSPASSRAHCRYHCPICCACGIA